MGWQLISYYAYGMILSPNDTPHEDVLLGLRRIFVSRIKQDPLANPYVGEPLCKPEVWWIGVDIPPIFNNDLPKFSVVTPLRAWPISNPYVVQFVSTLPNDEKLSKAKAEWEKFEQWCFVRGVDIRGRGQLLIVNDYD